ncbi:hypothetical protein EM864_10060 [Stenotrophomonas acidaminiphila]|uniref:hypothetical protein n=1 Tax=Stenotrophomonas acidaminiphila TaxID=128780 RepID=UPI0024051A27|nr:hypothetical protein [Stenotrophomonas acidaminiphila]MDF9442097.1 hypothetical protein [Stenotrophomonas acidaminiphila]
MTPSDFQAFAQRVLEKHRARAAENPRWALDLLRRQDSPTCAFCCSPIDVTRRQSWGLSPLVPFTQGGRVEPSNLQMACKACAVERGARDLLAWEELATKVPADHLNALKEERLKELKRSDNHLTYAGHYAKPSTVLALLQERWKHPRFLVYVERHGGGWFVGWPLAQRDQPSRNGAAVLLRQVHRARWLEHEGLVAFDVPDDVFQTAVWQLIEHHALVVDLAEGSAADGDRTWQESWRVLYPSFHQVRRRRTYPHEKPWPSHRDSNPLSLSTKASAVRMRAKRQAAREEETKRRWLDARRRLAKRDEDVNAGRLRPYLPGERDALQAEVDDLASTWLKARQRKAQGRSKQA